MQLFILQTFNQNYKQRSIPSRN